MYVVRRPCTINGVAYGPDEEVTSDAIAACPRPETLLRTGILVWKGDAALDPNSVRSSRAKRAGTAAIMTEVVAPPKAPRAPRKSRAKKVPA